MTVPLDFESDNLTPEEHERLLLMSEHAIAPPLSPAAQAVYHAIAARIYLLGEIAPSKQVAAAAIRAASCHLQRCSPWSNDDPGSIPVDWCTSELHNIATELENAQ